MKRTSRSYCGSYLHTSTHAPCTHACACMDACTCVCYASTCAHTQACTKEIGRTHRPATKRMSGGRILWPTPEKYRACSPARVRCMHARVHAWRVTTNSAATSPLPYSHMYESTVITRYSLELDRTQPCMARTHRRARSLMRRHSTTKTQFSDS